MLVGGLITIPVIQEAHATVLCDLKNPGGPDHGPDTFPHPRCAGDHGQPPGVPP